MKRRAFHVRFLAIRLRAFIPRRGLSADRGASSELFPRQRGRHHARGDDRRLHLPLPYLRRPRRGRRPRAAAEGPRPGLRAPALFHGPARAGLVLVSPRARGAPSPRGGRAREPLPGLQPEPPRHLPLPHPSARLEDLGRVLAPRGRRQGRHALPEDPRRRVLQALGEPRPRGPIPTSTAFPRSPGPANTRTPTSATSSPASPSP